MTGCRGGGRQRLDDDAFRRLVGEARDRYNISDVVGRYTTLKRAGGEFKGLCVFHEERTPSLYVNDAECAYHCFGCGESGDIIRFVMEKVGKTFFEALEWLGAAELPQVLEAERAKRAAENEAARAEAIAEARAIWNGSRPVAGTDAETYLRSRGITMAPPPSIRFAMTPRWRNRETGEVGPDTPALVGAVARGGDLVAVQCVFLRDHGRAKAKGKKPKLSRGRILGGALRLDHGRPASSEVIITEGPEDALSLAQELPEKRVWASLGTAMMPAIEYPDDVKAIVIAGQNDEPGRRAVAKAAERLTEMGFGVRTMWPDAAFKDWNDQLRGIRQ
jgi:DNA primase